MTQVINPVSDAGFIPDYVLEPLPTEEFRQEADIFFAECLCRCLDYIEDWTALFKEDAAASKVTGKQELEGTTVYVVEMDVEGIGKQKLFFGVESGLLFAIQLNPSGKNGLMTSYFLKDHREVEGILVPHSFDYRIKDMGIEILMTIEKIEFNEDIDESDLEVPKELTDAAKDEADK